MTPPKGLMQRFIASRGRITTVNTFNTQPRTREISPAAYLHKPITDSKTMEVSDAPRPQYTRKLQTAEDRIQRELQELKSREIELKQNRARLLARSQPNLLEAMSSMELDFEPDEELESPGALREKWNSNPNLLEDDDTASESSVQLSKTPRRRSPMIAKWESRIQQSET